jgi:predicted transcriptional regulator
LRTIVLSLKPKWAALISSGRKTIELRRRFPRYLADCPALVYESSPKCEVTATLRIGAIHELPVEDLWHVHGEASCVNQEGFATYFQGRDTGLGIEVTEHSPLNESWKLTRLREEFEFIAPQSWAYAPPRLAEAIRAFS